MGYKYQLKVKEKGSVTHAKPHHRGAQGFSSQKKCCGMVFDCQFLPPGWFQMEVGEYLDSALMKLLIRSLNGTLSNKATPILLLGETGSKTRVLSYLQMISSYLNSEAAAESEEYF